jgi:VIT1/CCC1 family predicted Fe2+/Mn2+ transporter
VRWGVLIVGLIVFALVASSWLGLIATIVVELLLQGVLSLIVGQWPFEEHESDEAAPV